MGSAFGIWFWRNGRGGDVGGRIRNSRLQKGFPSFDTGAAGAAVEKAALVAGPGACVVDFEFGSPPDDRGFIHRDKGAQKLDVGVGARIDRLGHGVEKRFATVRIDGVIAGVGRKGHGLGPDAFGIAGCQGKKNAVPKRDDGFFHRQLLVVTVGDFAAGLQQVGLEGLGQKGERHDRVLNAEATALVGGAGKFAGVMFGSVVEAEGSDDLLGGGHVMEDGDRVEASREKNDDFHGKKGLWASSWPTVVKGPWPGRRIVSGGRVRTAVRIASKAGR